MPFGDPRDRNNPRVYLPVRSILADSATAAKEAAEALMRDGAELRATQEILSTWLEKHGYFTAQTTTGECVAMRADAGYPGMHLEGRDNWPTYHEMIADLLARIDAKDGAS